MLECVKGLGVGLEVKFGFPMLTACVVCVLWVKDRVGSGDWLLRSRCTFGGVGLREGVRVCRVVWVLRGALFNVGVEVCECRCVCDGLLGVLLSCIVGWGVMFVVLKARGVVTCGVASTLYLAQVQVFIYCLVLVSVVQVVWTQSFQEVHRTKPLYFLLLVMHWEQMGPL